MKRVKTWMMFNKIRFRKREDVSSDTITKPSQLDIPDG